MAFITFAYIKSFLDSWKAVPARRWVWSLEKRLEWSLESMARKQVIRAKR